MTFTCKTCNASGFASLGMLRKHYKEVGHPLKKRGKRKPKVQEPGADRERVLLDAAAGLFDAELAHEVLAQDAYDRVCAYLVARYGSPAATDA